MVSERRRRDRPTAPAPANLRRFLRGVSHRRWPYVRDVRPAQVPGGIVRDHPGAGVACGSALCHAGGAAGQLRCAGGNPGCCVANPSHRALDGGLCRTRARRAGADAVAGAGQTPIWPTWAASPRRDIRCGPVCGRWPARSGWTASAQRPGPALGADTGAVLAAAGIDATARAALAADGVIGGQC